MLIHLSHFSLIFYFVLIFFSSSSSSFSSFFFSFFSLCFFHLFQFGIFDVDWLQMNSSGRSRPFERSYFLLCFLKEGGGREGGVEKGRVSFFLCVCVCFFKKFLCWYCWSDSLIQSGRADDSLTFLGGYHPLPVGRNRNIDGVPVSSGTALKQQQSYPQPPPLHLPPWKWSNWLDYGDVIATDSFELNHVDVNLTAHLFVSNQQVDARQLTFTRASNPPSINNQLESSRVFIIIHIYIFYIWGGD